MVKIVVDILTKIQADTDTMKILTELGYDINALELQQDEVFEVGSEGKLQVIEQNTPLQTSQHNLSEMASTTKSSNKQVLNDNILSIMRFADLVVLETDDPEAQLCIGDISNTHRIGEGCHVIFLSLLP